MTVLSEKRLHAAFEVGVVLKGLNGLAELVGGVVLWFASVDLIRSIVGALVHGEIIEDPQDRVASYLMHMADKVSVGGKDFAAFYLFSHGVVKLILVAGLLRNKLWAYPASLAVLGLFIAYQLYRLSFGFSLGLTLLTVFDAIIIVLIWHEYRFVEARRRVPMLEPDEKT
jgi:uncharacterized membrane protein